MSAAKLAARAVKALEKNEGDYIGEYAKPMGAFVIRFSGESLPHVGKVVDAAIDRLLATCGPMHYRGYLTTGKKSKRYAAPKTTDGAGRATMTSALATLKAMPKDATSLYFSDLKSDALVPNHQAFYVSLAADHETFATGRGFLSCAFPLDALDDPKWVALVDELVVLLAAEIAWLGPAVWLAPQCLFNGSLNEVEKPAALIALFAADPQLDIPNLFASRYPFSFDELEPGPLAGFVAPAWRMWLDGRLAKKVKKYRGTTAKLPGGRTRYHASAAPPYRMTEATYREWKARWDELSPVHVRNTDENDISAYYCGRFAAKSHAELGTHWTKGRSEEEARLKRKYEITNKLQDLARKPTPKLLAYADTIAKEMSSDAAWYFLPGLRQLVVAGKAKPAEALVWLDICEQVIDAQVLPKLAAVAAVAGDHLRAIDLLRRANKAGWLNPKATAKDPEFKMLRKDPAFVKLTGARR